MEVGVGRSLRGLETRLLRIRIWGLAEKPWV
jgi:hypothetical protein